MITFRLKNRTVKKQCHIYQTIRPRGKHISFHTPGHKCKGFDVTELDYTDNLCSPTGCILQAQTDIARILGADKSFILTDGSTCGVLSMLYAFSAYGGKRLAIPFDAHKSVKNGCKLTGVVFQEYAVEDLQTRLQEIVDSADGVLLVSPNYYGIIPPLQAVKDACQKAGKPLLIDGAHGGHLHNQPLYAGNFADVWVDGVHKSLPALTQGAVVSAKTETWSKWLEEAVGIFRTTSPSYPIMASVEYAVKYPSNPHLESLVRETASKLDRLKINDDWTKVLLLGGEYAFEIQQALEKKNIYAEFCDGEFLMFYLSPATTVLQFKTLIKAVKKVLQKYPYKAIEKPLVSTLYTVDGETEMVELGQAENRICAKECGLFPPCTPLIRKGERITKEKIELLQKANGTFGLTDGKIAVLKTREEE